MTNVYQKIYPDLMEGKKILYVHGFGSAGSTHTAQLLRDLMPQATVVAPDLPLHPQEAIDLLRTVLDDEKPDLIIGTSMGGMYAEMLYGYDRIVVNPAFEMGETMNKHGMVGKQVYQNPRQDGVQEFLVTKSLVKEYKEMTEKCFRGVNDEEKKRVYGLFGDEDPVVHTFDMFCKHYPQAIHFHGEHRLNEKVVMHYVVPVIRWIDDRRQGRERKTVFIDESALVDHYGQPKSSLNKAYEFLIEHYNVFVVATAPTNHHKAIADMQEWVERYLNAPAWNRVIFSNHKELLYGDYIIDMNPCEGFLGTTVEFGSSDFKTWEEVIVFFDRLNGQ